ncbi:MAG: acetolactate decarboxylase, partial [Methanotrichaceae archaeon]|nr:acetolactate decarboxylase [Methanotrichaceae archaeon]
HMHFITSDRSSGGHLLDCVVRNASVSLDEIFEFEMALPKDQDFQGADLSDDKQEELKTAESNPAAPAES